MGINQIQFNRTVSYPSINISIFCYKQTSMQNNTIKKLLKDYKYLKNIILADLFVSRTLTSSDYFILSLKNKNMNIELNMLWAQKCGPGFQKSVPCDGGMHSTCRGRGLNRPAVSQSDGIAQIFKFTWMKSGCVKSRLC